MKKCQIFIKVFLTIMMICGIIITILNYSSIKTGATSNIKRGLLIADEITGEKVCMGQGNECDLPPDDPLY